MSFARHAQGWLAGAIFSALLSHAAAQQPEFRALWADTFHAGLRTSAEVSALVNTARANNFNAIIVEVRKRGDAYYNSTIEPKASDVSPQSFDPLADLLTKAHTGGRRIEVHAWITTYLIWNNQGASPSQTNHPYLTHPEWLSVNNVGANWDGGNYQFDAALPAVQKHVHSVAMDIISRYDVDGFHFDYVRYSGKEWGYHPGALDRFRRRYNFNGTPATTDANWLQFRRDQVSGLVRKVYLNAIALKPQMKISAATICFAPGITTDAQWFSSASAWTDVLQDWRGWMREGILDLNVPMAYFRQHTHAADWAAWSTFAKEHAYGHQVAMGQGSYLNYLTNVIPQLRSTRVPTVNSNATAAGMAIYSYAVPSLDTSAATVWNALVNPSIYDTNPVPLFATAVDTPAMLWKTAPPHGHVRGTIRAAGTSNELDGAVVSIIGPVSRIQTNDATGFYGFAHLPPGNYTVTATYSNLAMQSAPVIVTTGVVSTVDFFLSASNAPLLNLRAFPGRTEAIVAWGTTNASDSQVEFGLTPALGNASWRDTSAVTNHAVLITGLLPNTNYFYRALTRAGGVTNFSATETFRTAGEIVMDNSDAAFAGTWTVGTSSVDKFGADYLFASTASPATATYTPNISTPGRYDVAVWYPQGANRSTNAPFLIAYSGGTTSGGVNQTINGGGWRVVATNLPFARGASGYFQWQSATPESPARVVMADAVRFLYATNQEPPAIGTVPQWWGEFFFGGVVNASQDPDTDGFNTEREYLAGTDPLRPISRLRYRLEDRTSNSLRMSFSPRHTGRAYELQGQTILSTNGWSSVSTTPQALPNGDGVFAVTNLTGQKFYRLRAQLPP
jgi:uncharacterized lipoprotein YddW (UPF0748 family)